LVTLWCGATGANEDYQEIRADRLPTPITALGLAATRTANGLLLLNAADFTLADVPALTPHGTKNTALGDFLPKSL
jgi:hypothetical protein